MYALVYVYIWKKLGRLLIATLVIALAAAAIYSVAVEMRTSRLQAHLFGKLARELSYKVEPGPSRAIRFPGPGPYDERLGYANLPDFLDRCKPHG